MGIGSVLGPIKEGLCLSMEESVSRGMRRKASANSQAHSGSASETPGHDPETDVAAPADPTHTLSGK